MKKLSVVMIGLLYGIVVMAQQVNDPNAVVQVGKRF